MFHIKTIPVNEPGRTADGVLIQAGMTLWVNASVPGDPPVKVRAAFLNQTNDRIFHFEESDQDGYSGAKCSSAWSCPRKAMLHALMMGEIWKS